MAEIVTDTSAPAMVTAIEENLFAFFDLQKHNPKVELHNDPDMLWSITNIPFPLFNPVLRARLSPATVHAAIDTAIARCRARNVPMFWFIGPTSQPPDLGAQLLAHGFVHIGDLAGMAVDVRDLNDHLPQRSNVTVTPVNDAEALQTWAAIAAPGFAMPEFAVAAIADFFLRLGFGPHVPLRHYVGWAQEQPVAIASLFLGAGVVGIYNVATIPEARRQGIASALTLNALRDGAASGYRIAVLQSSSMASGVYRQLGFQEYCTISQYLWVGEQASDAAG